MRMYREVFVLPFALQGLVAEPLCMAAVRHPPPVPQNLNPRRPSAPRLGGSSFPSWLLIHRPVETVVESCIVLPGSQLSHPLPSLLVFQTCLAPQLWGGVELQDGFLFAEPQRDLG